VLPDKLPKEASVFSDSTSLVWKNTKVIRMLDAKRNTLVYVAISRRVIEGSPMNAVSAVPIAKWDAR
jgi:CreA protein